MEIIKKISFFTCIVSLYLCSCSDRKTYLAEDELILFHNFVTDSVTLSFYDKYSFTNNATLFGFDYCDTLPDGSICHGCGCYYNQDKILLNWDTAIDVASIMFYVNKLGLRKLGAFPADTLPINYRLIDITDTYNLRYGSINKYYFCGKLLLHKDLESFVFLEQGGVPNTNPIEILGQSLYLFNIKNNRIVSVIELFSRVPPVYAAGLHCCYESFRERNIFVHFSDKNREKIKKRFFGNNSIEDTKKKLKNIDCIFYKVNEDGYIEIIK